MEILTNLNIKENTKIDFNNLKQRDSRQVKLSDEEIGKLIARYNNGKATK